MAGRLISKILLLLLFLPLLLVVYYASVYFQTSAAFESEYSFENFEIAPFPDWAFCYRGVEYGLKGAGSSVYPQVFKDAQGRLLEGKQRLRLELMRKERADGAENEVSLGLRDAVGNWVSGLMEGELQVFHDNGQPAWQCSYRSGVLNGMCRSFSLDGNLTNEVEYSEGKPTGVFRSYSPDHTLMAEGNPDYCQEYSIDGKKLVKRVYADKAETYGCTPNRKETIREGDYVLHKEYRGIGKDGKVSQTASVWEYYSGMSTHALIFREKIMNGLMVQKEAFLGTVHILQDFDENGVLRREIHQSAPQNQGIVRWYDERGRLRVEGYRVGLLRDGIFKWYSPDGRSAWSALYVQGTLFGEALYYKSLNVLLWLLVQAIFFLLFYPLYSWLRVKIRNPFVSHIAILIIMFLIVYVASYSFYLLMSSCFIINQ